MSDSALDLAASSLGSLGPLAQSLPSVLPASLSALPSALTEAVHTLRPVAMRACVRLAHAISPPEITSSAAAA